MLNLGLLTVSTKGWRGQRQDRSAEAVRNCFLSVPSRVVKYEVVPDEKKVIAGKLAEWADAGDIDVIITSGGTGLSPTDVTPEATLSIIDKMVPGLAEVMRLKTFSTTPMAVLSRAVAGVRKRCLIVNLPGSPKAVSECLDVILPAIPHAVAIIREEVTEHQIPDRGEGQVGAH